MTTEQNKPYCILPWFHQLTRTDGKLMPCCSWQGDAIDDSSGFLHSKFMNGLRDTFMQGKAHDGCVNCVYQESVEGSSLRTRSWQTAEYLKIDWAVNPVLRSQEVHFSNLCNQKCRTCDQTRSTKWIADAEALGQPPLGLQKSNWQLNETDAANTSYLIFLGGEPMLHQNEIKQALRMVKKYGDISKLSIIINSNLSLPFEQEVLDLLLECSHTHVTASIDAAFVLNEYIRSDSIWIDTAANLQQLVALRRSRTNLSFNIGSVYSVLNVNKYDEFLEWLDSSIENVNVSVIFLQEPRCYDARNLRDEFKIKLIDRYRACLSSHPKHEQSINGIIQHLQQPSKIPYPKFIERFRQYNDFLDDRRVFSLLDVNKELYDELMSSMVALA